MSRRLSRIVSLFFVLAAVHFAPSVQAQGRALPDFTDLVDKVGPTVVNIRTTQSASGQRGGARPGQGADEDNPFCELFPWMCPPRGERAPRPQRPQ